MLVEGIELRDVWENALARQVRELAERSGADPKTWRTGGRKTKERPNGETLQEWKAMGLKQVEDYIAWFEKSGWKIATMPNGKPAIEWEAEVQFGGLPVRLVIDAIYEVGDDWVVVDYKTGARTPYGVLQLAQYASAVEKVYGKRPKWGAFYMTRKAELSPLTDLTPWGIDYFEYGFAAMNQQIELGLFPPNVGDHCSYCGFAEYCVAVNGSKSKGFPLVQPTKEK